MGNTCQMCGTANENGVKFCSACGSPLISAAGETIQAVKNQPDQKAKTMMFGVSPLAGSKPEAKPKTQSMAANQGAAAGNKTMLGLPTPGDKPATAARPVVTTSSAPPRSGNASASHKTMLGISPSTALAEAKAKARAQAKPIPVAQAKPIPVAQAKPSSPPMAKIVTPGTEKTSLAPLMPAAKEDFGKRTVLGMPALGADIVGEGAPDASPPQNAPAGSAATAQQPAVPREMASHPPKTEPMPAFGGAESNSNDEVDNARKEAPLSNTFDTWPEEDEPEASRGRGVLIALVIAAFVAVCAAGLAVYLLAFAKNPMLTPQVYPSPDGRSVTVTLRFDKAPPGTIVQLVGQTASLVQGQAQVLISMDQLKLGTNEVAVSYTEPGESPKQMMFPIVLRHAIADDFSGLVAEKPFVTIAFQVAPEVGLAVEGKPTQVVNGAYLHRIDLDELMAKADPGSDHIMHKVSFQLTSKNGMTEQGEHMVAIPITRLQIDRPAENAVIATEAITCSGTSEEGAQVTVNGRAVGLTTVGFNTSLPLPAVGAHTITVIARAPGKAPRTHTVQVTRLESFDAAIAQWSQDLDTALDYPTIGRDPNALADKKVKLNGRVVNISTEKGVTAFILYVGEGCPAQAQCGVYVVYRGETGAGLQSWVDVYGKIRGNRAVDLQDGRKMEMPAIDAQFVVLSEPKLSAKGKTQ